MFNEKLMYQLKPNEWTRRIRVICKDPEMQEDIIPKDEIKQESYLKVSSQELDYFPEGSYLEQAMQRQQERRNEAEINRRVAIIKQEYISKGTIHANTTSTNIPREKQQIPMKQEEKTIPKELKVILFEKPVSMKFRNQKSRADERQQKIVEARLKGLKAPPEAKNRLQIPKYFNDIKVTDKATLYALLDQQKKNKANILPDNMAEKIQNTPDKIKNHFGDISSTKKASQEINFQNMTLTINEITVMSPILICSGIEDRSGRQIEFIYRPGFESEVSRNEFSQSKLDFDFAEKPKVGEKYLIFYRTLNTQNKIVAEKIEKLE